MGCCRRRQRGTESRTVLKGLHSPWVTHSWDEQRCSGMLRGQTWRRGCRCGRWKGMSGDGQQEQRAVAGLSSESTRSTAAWRAGAASPSRSITPFLLHCKHLVSTEATDRHGHNWLAMSPTIFGRM